MSILLLERAEEGRGSTLARNRSFNPVTAFSSLLEIGLTQSFPRSFSLAFFFSIYISKTLSKVFHLKIHRLTSLKCMAEDLNTHFGRCS
jgi:hypothetical protein